MTPRRTRWLAGALAAVGAAVLGTAVYMAVARTQGVDAPPAERPPAEQETTPAVEEPGGPAGGPPVASGGVLAENRAPPPGFTPGPGGKRDEPVALDAALEKAVLNPDGSVTASGYLVCTPGEKMNVGFAVWNQRGHRDGGMVRTGTRRLYFECTGERQEWRLQGSQILGGGIEPGPHAYTVKTAVGTGSRHDHRDYFQGTITVQG